MKVFNEGDSINKKCYHNMVFYDKIFIFGGYDITKYYNFDPIIISQSK